MIGNEVQSNGIEVEIVNLIENVVENQLLKNQDLKMLKMKRKKNRKEKDRGHQKTESLKNQAKDRNHVKDLVEGARADLVQKINTVLMKLHVLETFLKKKLKRKRFVKDRVVSSKLHLGHVLITNNCILEKSKSCQERRIRRIRWSI